MYFIHISGEYTFNQDCVHIGQSNIPFLQYPVTRHRWLVEGWLTQGKLVFSTEHYFSGILFSSRFPATKVILQWPYLFTVLLRRDDSNTVLSIF